MSHGNRNRSRQKRSAPSVPPWCTPKDRRPSDSDGELQDAARRRESYRLRRMLSTGEGAQLSQSPQRTKLVQPTTPVSDVKKEEGSYYPSEKSSTAAEHPVRIKNQDDRAE